MLQKLAKRKEKIEIRLPIAMLLLFKIVWKRFFTLFTIVWSKSLPRGPGVMIVIGGAFVVNSICVPRLKIVTGP